MSSPPEGSSQSFGEGVRGQGQTDGESTNHTPTSHRTPLNRDIILRHPVYFQIWGPPPEIADDGGVFAAETAARTIAYFETYFDVLYELPKIDSAAIPDFAAG